ncbi:MULTISPECIES: tyrosine-type recombinase/integrase [Cytobacillus]|uniref:tyrosine-type recombinase/integrase n=1 Tax=Cytobacillus TaxID=2675230 RepID=UPI00203FD8CE|nr:MULTISPECIES: tyrosine-type recombinase/integrase [Cytobacillus]MCM3394828.1 tyrosine-type recombinase/integrase [Cytobacillus oceanisediminis]UQX56095.1 tyrosine-type recombinase/integrase [Cytobacillus pseudoceanisediminis]
MFLEDVLKEYIYHCMAKGYPPKTMKNKRQELKQLKEYLVERRGINELESVTPFDLKAYVRFKQQAGLQPQSIVSMFKMIKAFFSWCEKEGYLKENIAKRVETPKVPKKVLKGFNASDIQAMIDAFTFKNYIEARNKAIIAMLADCGLRAMELRGLLNVNVKETSILVNGKGNKERLIFVSPALKRILIKYERVKTQHFKDKITTDHYFLSYKGTELSHVGLDNVIKLAGNKAGVEGKRISPHSFRHFFATQFLLNANFHGNVDIYTLSKLLGHSEISTTQRYLSTLEDFELIKKAMPSSPLMNMNRR